MSIPQILIVEDEHDIAAILQEDLRRQGYETAVVGDGEKAIRCGLGSRWDLILLDVMLPGIDGFDVCRALRRAGVSTPIVLLTARTADAEKEVGLDSGADDYVTKPFSARELRARIRAHLRRASAPEAQTHRFSDCEVDFERAEVRRDGKRLEITAQEFRLLQVFLRYPGKLLTRDRLIETAWGPGISCVDRVVDTHVFNLRRKIERNPGKPRHLLSVRGLGYRFEL